MHRAHGDLHIEGLADDCAGCAEIAENPFREADERLLRQLIELAVDRDRLAKGRSETELVASAKILTHFEKLGRACEAAGDVIAGYLRDRWHLPAQFGRRPCPYCKGWGMMENAIDGWVACRVCLGSGDAPYEGDLGHDARPRELRRIAELLTKGDQEWSPPVTSETKERVSRVLDLGAAVIVLLENETPRERIHELVDVAADEYAGSS